MGDGSEALWICCSPEAGQEELHLGWTVGIMRSAFVYLIKIHDDLLCARCCARLLGGVGITLNEIGNISRICGASFLVCMYVHGQLKGINKSVNNEVYSENRGQAP